MSRRPIGDRATAAAQPQPYNVVAYDPEDRKGRLKSVGGSQSDRWNNLLINQVAQALWLKDSNHEQREQQLNAAIAAMVGIAPKDELEGMMAAQLIAAHAAVMDCHRRVMTIENYEARNKYLGTAAKLSRSYAMLLEALNRHRGKGQQHVTVEHVHINQQAVVGVVEAPGGRANLEGQPHATQITNAPQPALWGADTERQLVPAGSNGERSLSHARRPVAGRAEGR